MGSVPTVLHEVVVKITVEQRSTKERYRYFFIVIAILIVVNSAKSIAEVRQIKNVDFLLRLRFGGIAKHLCTIYE